MEEEFLSCYQMYQKWNPNDNIIRNTVYCRFVGTCSIGWCKEIGLYTHLLTTMTSNNVIYYGVHRISTGFLEGEYHYNVLCKNVGFQAFLETFTPPEEFKITITKPDDDDEEEIHTIKTVNLKKYIDDRAEDKIKLDKALKRGRQKYQEWMLMASPLSFCDWIKTQ